jgi:hypothetical protein
MDNINIRILLSKRIIQHENDIFDRRRRNSAVGIGIRPAGCKIRGSNPGRVKIPLSSPNRPDLSGAQSASHSMSIGIISWRYSNRGVKLTAPPCSDAVKREWSYTSTPPEKEVVYMLPPSDRLGRTPTLVLKR